ncbi:predicted protein [Lodderomyces elongisporus NRRL YB-4239]|uniref:Uncharacterized protein n=1 Tax=Lodderomyces elongisporus (strain ATCC 11503 / CBS 2605 / JCM 1781 / NBRC 1676 / NRRL YB-4239) TaxID=379508 RepID=A5DYW0_LODEL|nr:predicted protein [Lodderomyces elongisporus NRRL YB-4239]
MELAAFHFIQHFLSFGLLVFWFFGFLFWLKIFFLIFEFLAGVLASRFSQFPIVIVSLRFAIGALVLCKDALNPTLYSNALINHSCLPSSFSSSSSSSSFSFSFSFPFTLSLFFSYSTPSAVSMKHTIQCLKHCDSNARLGGEILFFYMFFDVMYFVFLFSFSHFPIFHFFFLYGI